MPDSNDWFTPPSPHTEPLVDPRRLPSGDWRQDAAYPAPLWDESAAAIARRVSIENGHQLYALALDPTGAELESLLNLTRWASLGVYRLGVVESADPIAEGFLRRLRFSHDREAPTQPIRPLDLLHGFIAAEHARIDDMEAWLRRRYGERPPRSKVFDWIDYPVFDCGTMCLGFAALVHGPELHCWSRVRHAHK